MSAMTEDELKQTLRVLYVHNGDTSTEVDVPALWAGVNETMRALPEDAQKRIGAWVAVNLPRRRPDDDRFAFAQWLRRQHETG